MTINDFFVLIIMIIDKRHNKEFKILFVSNIEQNKILAVLNDEYFRESDQYDKLLNIKFKRPNYDHSEMRGKQII